MSGPDLISREPWRMLLSTDPTNDDGHTIHRIEIIPALH
jgi:hypothetical protein